MRRLSPIWAATFTVSVLLIGVASAAAATQVGTPASGTLYFTRFCNEGGLTGCTADGLAADVNVGKVDYSFDGLTFTQGTPSGIATTSGADGIVFAPNGNLLIGGQQNGSVSEITTTGSAVTTKMSGVSGAFHLVVPDSSDLLVGGIPGGLGIVPLSGGLDGNGAECTIGGDVTGVDTVLYVGGTYYYTSSTPGGYGEFGTMTFSNFGTNTCTASTTKVLPSGLGGYPASHGMAYDPLTGDIFLMGDNMISQYRPGAGIIGELVFGPANTCTVAACTQLIGTAIGSEFDQGAVDGRGHVFAAANSGELVFVDYSASMDIHSQGTVSVEYLAGSLDDIAPLVGPGAAPITTQTREQSATGGDKVQDTVHVNGFSPTGTVTFKLYGPNDPECSGTTIDGGTIAINGSGDATSIELTVPNMAGTYQWVASYGGDNNNLDSTSMCGSEPVVVTEVIPPPPPAPTPTPPPTPGPTPTAPPTPAPTPAATPTPTGVVEAATGTPNPTLPPTSTIDGQGPSNPGGNLGLILLSLAGLIAVLGFITPSPARIRQRNRRG